MDHDALRTWMFDYAWDTTLRSMLRAVPSVTVTEGQVVLAETRAVQGGEVVTVDPMRDKRYQHKMLWFPLDHDATAFPFDGVCAELREAVFGDLVMLLNACTTALETHPHREGGVVLAPDEAAQAVWRDLRDWTTAYVVGGSRGGPLMSVVRAQAYRAAGFGASTARDAEFGDPNRVPTLEALHLLGALTP